MDQPIRTVARSRPRDRRCRFHLSVEIGRTPSEVYAFLADIQTAEPIPRRAVVRMVKDPVGGTVVGTRWHESVRVTAGLWIHVESVVTDVVAPRHLGMDFSSPWFTGHLAYDIEATSDGSTLHQREELLLRRPLRWLSPWVESRLRPRLRQRLADIRTVLEGPEQSVR